MSKADEFRAIAAEMARYAKYAMLPEIREEYQERAGRWLRYADEQERQDASSGGPDARRDA
jgi:hypothetical protein